MNPAPETQPINPEKWTSIFATLSLDLAAPHIGRMGLDLPDGFREGLRRLIEQFRQHEAEPAIAARFIPAVLEWAAQQYGQPFAEYLYQWGEQVFQPDEGSGAIFLWSSVLRHTGYHGHQPPSPPPAFVIRHREVMAKTPALSIYNLQPVTPWDRTIYQRLNYDEPLTSMDLVQSVIDRRDFLLAWATVRQEMPGPEYMAAVKTWGLDVATRMGMPVDRLGEPGDWQDPPVQPPA